MVVSGAHTLQLGANSDLELRNSSGSLLWSSNAGAINATVELLEVGNLRMLDIRSNTILWQSFDHPSNVMLPTQVLTLGMRLVAGDYSAVLEAGGLAFYVNTPDPLPYLVLNSSWGLSDLDSVLNPACNGLRLAYDAAGNNLTMEFNASAASGCGYNQSMNAILKANSMPVTLSPSNSTAFRYLRLESSGDFKTFLDDETDFSWFIESDDGQGKGFCNLPSHCGDYGICDPGGECRCPNPIANQSSDYFMSLDYTAETPLTGSCPMIQPLNCTGSPDGFKWLRLQDLEYFPHRYLRQSAHANTSNLDNCLSSCSSNCSCIVAFYNNQTRVCHHYSKTLTMQRSTYGANFLVFFKIIPERAPANRPSSVVIAIIAGSTVVAASIVFFSVYRRCGKRSSNTENAESMIGRSQDDTFLDSIAGLPPRYSVEQLQQITNGFTVKLGAGGFGSVYEGTLADGTKIAVKKLEGTGQGDKEFRAEVAALAGLSHVNLVELRGFCAEGAHRMLVYEYMTNGSLDKWLCNHTVREEAAPRLDWQTRLRVAVDAARGLAFLHGESRDRIFHLDVKPQNLLLDDNFVAKLSDFGLAKLLERGGSTRSWTVTTMRGTPGYLAPEWLLQMSVSDKSDVYSFGMLLMEVVSGRRNVDYSSASGKRYWPAWVLHKAQEGQWEEVIEEASREGTQGFQVDEEITRAIKVALWCVQEDPQARPPMAKVLLMLEGYVAVPDPPLNMQHTLEAHAKLLSDLRLSSSSPIATSTTVNSYGGSISSTTSLLHVSAPAVLASPVIAPFPHIPQSF